MNHNIVLSVIVPTFNDSSQLAEFLSNILSQRIKFGWELIIVDGGSTDRTLASINDCFDNANIPIVTVHSRKGRAVQMNAGVLHARGDDLLFLHCDTRIVDESLLQRTVYYMLEESSRLGDHNVAGHFRLLFNRKNQRHSLAYYFYEAKTSVNLPDTINGDQGIYIKKSFFIGLGGFDEGLEYMEDARLARLIFDKGKWLQLPGTIYTSARRFESEGLYKRQLLNVVLRVFDKLDKHDFFDAAQGAYQQQNNTRGVVLYPFFFHAHQSLFKGGYGKAFKLWYGIGCYFAENVWQLLFLADCIHNKKKGKMPGNGDTRIMDIYSTYFARIVNSGFVKVLCSIFICSVFYLTYFVLFFYHKMKKS